MIEVELTSHLTAEVTEVNGRVYPTPMPQNCLKPVLVYTVVSSVDTANMDGWCGDSNSKMKMQIDVYSVSYKEKKIIKESVKQALKSFKYPVYSITNRDIFEEETELYRELIEFKI